MASVPSDLERATCIPGIAKASRLQQLSLDIDDNYAIGPKSRCSKCSKLIEGRRLRLNGIPNNFNKKLSDAIFDENLKIVGSARDRRTTGHPVTPILK